MCTHAAQAREPGPRSCDVSRAARGLLVLAGVVRGRALSPSRARSVPARLCIDYRGLLEPQIGRGASAWRGWGRVRVRARPRACAAVQRAREILGRASARCVYVRPLDWALDGDAACSRRISRVCPPTRALFYDARLVRGSFPAWRCALYVRAISSSLVLLSFRLCFRVVTPFPPMHV